MIQKFLLASVFSVGSFLSFVPVTFAAEPSNLKPNLEISRFRSGGHSRPGHGHRPRHPVYPYPGNPAYPIQPGYPAPYYPAPHYPTYPNYGMMVCTAHNNFGYYWQGVGYNQWEASQAALSFCYQRSGYCQVTGCYFR